jgi:protein translocase SecG subunit
LNPIFAAVTAAARAASKAAAPSAPQVPIQPLPQAAPPSPQSFTWIQLHAGWLTHSIAAVFILSAISLIALLAVQTTKQEGLSGTLGGRVESAYGRPGAEEQLKRVTGLAATLFVVCGTILALTGI